MDDELGPGEVEGPVLGLVEEDVDEEELGISVVEEMYSRVLGLSVVEGIRSVVDGELEMSVVDVGVDGGMLASVVDILVVLVDASVDEGEENVLEEDVVVVRLMELVEKAELDVLGVVRLAFEKGIGLVDELSAAVVSVEAVERVLDEFAVLVGLIMIRVDALVDKVYKVVEVLKAVEV